MHLVFPATAGLSFAVVDVASKLINTAGVTLCGSMKCAFDTDVHFLVSCQGLVR